MAIFKVSLGCLLAVFVALFMASAFQTVEARNTKHKSSHEEKLNDDRSIDRSSSEDNSSSEMELSAQRLIESTPTPSENHLSKKGREDEPTYEKCTEEKPWCDEWAPVCKDAEMAAMYKPDGSSSNGNSTEEQPDEVGGEQQPLERKTAKNRTTPMSQTSAKKSRAEKQTRAEKKKRADENLCVCNDGNKPTKGDGDDYGCASYPAAKASVLRLNNLIVLSTVLGLLYLY